MKPIQKKLKLENKNAVLYISLNRPEVHNALDEDLISDLSLTFRQISKDKTVRAVVLRGEGPSFCAGGDLNWMRKSIKYKLAQNIKDAQKLSDMYENIFNCPVPVLGLVHGSVMGGGVGLVAVCDIVAAETETKFCLSEVKLGLVPAIISPYVLRKIPEAQAKPLMLTAEIFKASQAMQIGLAHFSETLLNCEIFLENKLKLILNAGPEAVRSTKDLVHHIETSSWAISRRLAVKTIAQRRVSKEGQEGMNAFFEKRKPFWLMEGE